MLGRDVGILRLSDLSAIARCVRDLQEQRRFSDARFAADEDGRAGDDSAAEDAVEFADAGGRARGIGVIDFGERERLRRRGDVAGLLAGPRAAARASGVGALYSCERVPRAAVGAFAHPLGMDRAAVVAEELRPRFGHRPIVADGATLLVKVFATNQRALVMGCVVAGCVAGGVIDEATIGDVTWLATLDCKAVCSAVN